MPKEDHREERPAKKETGSTGKKQEMSDHDVAEWNIDGNPLKSDPIAGLHDGDAADYGRKAPEFEIQRFSNARDHPSKDRQHDPQEAGGSCGLKDE
ncbi:hypothetical protein MKK67_18150 [Methylobacterium sp. J-072]|uniref:hypothetical protein n=1 Tax=Methylobacterium sp. J-072 TaxID=2836651 RepID=UPI001FB8B849|nr:hypothetical protein [Methylobacterium sp. J-072]MCJ2094400.1 hypothetical protein [Methylobacterium sp. J-072]